MSARSPRDLWNKAIAATLLATMALVLAARLFASDALWHLAWGAVAATLFCTAPRLRLREFYLLALSLVIAAVVWATREDRVEILTAALDQAGFLMVFILLLALLREAAVTSPSVGELGAFLTRQPAGRRYAALYSGTAFMAVIFNIGVVSFLVPLIQRGIARANTTDGRDAIRERRQISAMLRGFAWSVIWSPTALAPLALMELIPGVDRLRWIGWGLVVFALVLALGWAEERWRFRAYRPTGAIRPLPMPPAAAARFAASCGWLLGLSWIIAELRGESVVFGLMVSCPIMLVGWLVAQNGIGPTGRRATAARLREILIDTIPASGPIAVTLAASGFLGRAGAGVVPGDALVAALHLDTMPDWMLLAAIPVVLSLFSLLAFSPIMMAIFFGSLFGGLTEMPADPTLIALAISCGWALSMTFSPFATVVLLIQRISGIPALRLTLGWNVAFTVLSAALLAVFFAAIRP
ncbi:hypothetical protein Ga0609869_002129 [Rhodovulum iodosum]|uniref:Uncharacterized protein n=1 Tax=Rhodovulum iodosum TaxID=68291 RepID=A0ABV3XTV3_9RHOB|nr:hypothetical protein [Rhodovulum robiginosum]RSK32210.1 hypothetical protein EJA01_13410 [Rhodovulum robiginosum]